MPIFTLRASNLRINSAGNLRLYRCILDFMRRNLHLYIHGCQLEFARRVKINLLHWHADCKARINATRSLPPCFHKSPRAGRPQVVDSASPIPRNFRFSKQVIIETVG